MTFRLQPRFPMREANTGEGWQTHVYQQHAIAAGVTGDRRLRELHKADHEAQKQAHTHNWLHGVWRDA